MRALSVIALLLVLSGCAQSYRAPTPEQFKQITNVHRNPTTTENVLYFLIKTAGCSVSGASSSGCGFASEI